MKIELQPGESVIVIFAETDGEIKVGYSAVDGITVIADLPDKAGRSGMIYHEPLGIYAEKT